MQYKKKPSYQIDSDFKAIDISGVPDYCDSQLIPLRQDLENAYERNRSYLSFFAKDIEIVDLTLPQSNQIVKIAFRPVGDASKKSILTHFLEFRGASYSLIVRNRPYSTNHFVFGGCLEQEDVGYEQILLGLTMARILGEEYDVVFNGVAPTVSNFHFQSMHKISPIWTADLTKWPVSLEMLEGSNLRIRELAFEIFGKYWGYLHDNKRIDILINATPHAIKVIIIPRVKGKTRPDKEMGDKNQFGTFGVMEMAGVCLVPKDRRAFEKVRDNPTIYEDSLLNLSLPKQ